MNEHLRDRILRRLETLSDDRGYQVLDYVEFLESKYAERPQPSTTSPFTRFAEAIEDRMRAGKMSAQTISETMGLMNKAMGILNGVAAAGRSMADDFIGTAGTAAGGSTPPPRSGGTGSATSGGGTAGTPPASATGSTPPPTSRPGDDTEGSSPQGGPRT
jgi:hypothetical protein